MSHPRRHPSQAFDILSVDDDNEFSSSLGASGKVKRTETELTAMLLSAAKSSSKHSDIVKAMKLNAKSVDKYIKRSINRGMLLKKNGALQVSRKGERFLSEFNKLQLYRQEYLRRLKLLREMLPSSKSKRASS